MILFLGFSWKDLVSIRSYSFLLTPYPPNFYFERMPNSFFFFFMFEFILQLEDLLFAP